ncbi:MAG: helix-turn-helix domain-containing protein [Brevibacterium sp.]
MAGKASPIGPTGDTVRSNIEMLRKGEGLSYAELSRRLGEIGREIPPLGLRRLEAGERRVDVDDLTALAVVLDVAPVRLLMPSTWSTAIDAEATGTGVRSTQDLWNWARGYAPLGESGPASLKFRRRSAPRPILTKRERIDARRSWVDSKIQDLENEIRSAEGDYDHSDPLPGIPSYIRSRREEIEILEQLDIEDDNAFEEIGESDPAPPSPEELAGLLREGDDDA